MLDIPFNLSPIGVATNQPQQTLPQVQKSKPVVYGPPAPTGDVKGASTVRSGGNTSSGNSGAVYGPAAPSASNTGKTLSSNAADQAKKAAEEARKKEAENRSAYENTQRSGIQAAYDPIFAELDRQIGTIPDQQRDVLGQLENLSGQQKAEVESARAKGQQNLDQSRDTEFTQAKSSLRDLENDIRNNLQAYQFYFGTRGAGDSSATGLASEAVAKGGLKARSNILGVRDKALGDIEIKRAEVDSLAGEQNRKIDEWKSNKVYDTTTYFKDKLDKLNNAKANASADKQNSINSLIANTQADYIGRLRQIDDDYNNFNNSVNMWKEQRIAGLEDYAAQLGIASKYGSGSAQKLQFITDSFGNIYAANPYSGAVQQQVESPYAGLITGEDNKNNSTFSLSNLLNLVPQAQ